MRENKEKKDFFDGRCEHWKKPEPQKYALIKEKIMPLLELKKGEKVLDACGGTGILIPALKDYGVSITEFDYSPKMTDKARELHENDAEFVTGNIENMPFEDKVFDKIICHNCLPHIEDKRKAFNGCARVLKKGGILLVSHDLSRKETDDLHKKCHKSVCEDMMPSNKEITMLAAAAGFETVEIFDEEKYFAAVCRK
ncbi:MAG: class I SAM-dependent methyltransferase [Endomicrobium sp.]|jgi:ubiquinone/menaquinone biosynthesis C-methylase UbiE|nr:class I SAM-dependent methyltransferase [Endomicrobium sp.]